MKRRLLIWAIGLAVGVCSAVPASAQNYGIELFNGAAPASGAMAGVSLARPQDAPSALFGNPATMTQYPGVTFTAGGAWIESSIDVTHDGFLTRPVGGGAFSGRSEAQGTMAGSFAVLQDLSFLGVNGNMGLGLNPGSGGATNFRNIPSANGLAAELLALDLTMGPALKLTDKLSIGATVVVSYSVAELGLAQASGASHDYGLGGSFGASYDLPMETTIGAYYKTKIGYIYQSMFRLPNGTFENFRMERPDTIGIGIANRSLMDGKLLVAVDLMYIMWEDADLWKDLFRNQFAVGIGAQYDLGKLKPRVGYSYNQNPIKTDPGINVSGFTVGANALQLMQATQAPTINHHRFTGGVGVKDVIPGVDFDLFAGGMFRESFDYGPHTSGSTVAWFVGFGMTWRMGCPNCN